MRSALSPPFLRVGVFLSLLLSSFPLFSQAPPSRQTVLEMLSGYEDLPSKADLEALGAGVPSTLMEIASDPELMKHHRLRAVQLLRHYPDRPEVQTFLTTLLSQKDLSPGLLRSAIQALGMTAKGRSIDTIKPYLSSKDVHIREAAAQALFDTGDPSVGALLKSAATSEPEPFLKQRMVDLNRRLESGKRDSEEKELQLRRARERARKQSGH